MPIDAAGQGSEAVALAEQLREELVGKAAVEHASGMSKVQHTINKVGMVVRIYGRMHYLVGSLSTLLLGLDHSTAEAILAGILRQDPGSLHRKRFPRKVRVCDSDNAGYNDRAERGLGDLRGETWDRVRFGCEVHYDSGTHTRVYDLSTVKEDVTGMVQTTLALNAFEMINTWRIAARKASLLWSPLSTRWA